MTLRDALGEKFAEILSVQQSLKGVSTEDLPNLINEDLSQKKSMRKKKTSFYSPYTDVQLKQLFLNNIKGEFSIVVYHGEKCVFRDKCERSHCLLKCSEWSVRQFPFSCGIPSTIGDCMKVIYP